LQQTRDNLVVWSEAYQEENPGCTMIKIPTNTLLIPPQGTKVNFESPSQVLLPTPLSYVSAHLLPNKHKTKEKRKNTQIDLNR